MYTTTRNAGVEVKEKKTVNRRGIQRRRITELMHLHTTQKYSKGETTEEGAVLGLLSEN